MRRVELRPASQRRLAIGHATLARAKQQISGARINPFKLPTVPPGVVPDGGPTMAMDNGINQTNDWSNQQSTNAVAFWGGLAYASAYQEGLAFPGYAFLSELAQRPEYRRMSETLAMEMTRKWIELQSAGDVDKTAQIKELNDELDRLCARDAFRKCVELDGFFGRSHLYIDTGDTNDRTELKHDIGNGRNKTSEIKVQPGMLERLKPVEPVWTYPTNYDSIDPLTESWYEPNTWFVMGKEVHKSRLLKFVGREVPDLLKPAYSFGGLSMSQMAMPYVNNWLRTRQSVADIIHAFSVFLLKTDLSESLMQGGQQLFDRAEFFNALRDNKGLMLIDKDAEDFMNVSAPLGSLDALQAQTQEHMASVSGIPIVKLLGIQPAGLNASSEGELRTFYDWILAMQEKMIRPNLTVIIDFAMLNLWGKVDKEITFKFIPLWALDEKGLADVRASEAETDVKLIESGVISPLESRKRLAADPDSPYASIDVEDVPDLREEEEAGLEPHAGAAKLAEGAGEEQGEIDVPNRGTGGAKSNGGPPHEQGDGLGGEHEADDSEPFETGELRPDYVAGKNPLADGAARRDAQPDHPGRGSPKNRKLAEKALRRQQAGELDPDYLDGENPLDGKNPLTGKSMNKDYLKGKNPLTGNEFRQRAAERNNANPDHDPKGMAHDGRRQGQGGKTTDGTPDVQRGRSGFSQSGRQTEKDERGNEDDEVGQWDWNDWGEWDVTGDDAPFEEGKHPRDSDGKFAAYKGGNKAMKAQLQGGGFKKAPSSSAGKHKFTNEHGDTIVIEPPSGGHYMSTHWTVHPKTGEKKSGKGNASLEKALTDLGKQNTGKSSEFDKPKGEPKSPDTTKSMNDVMNKHGYSYESDDQKSITFKKGDSKIKIANAENPGDGIKWLSYSPGHQTKIGKGAESLNALLSGGDLSGVTNTTSNFDLWPANPYGEQETVPAEKHHESIPGGTSSPHSFEQLNEWHAKSPKPSSQQKTAINAYTDGSYGSMNFELRQGGSISPGSQSAHLQEWLELASFPEDTTVYRRIHGDYVNFLKSIMFEGAMFQDKGFVSTTNRNLGMGSGDTWIMHIAVKKGAKGAPVNQYSNYPGEQEIIFKAGSKYKVLSYDEKHIKVELITD